ncbi:MAG: cytochrome c [Bdellovibrionales bacterium]|nr:cytochrome c [Bdellovibrionales bacterium]
MVVNLRAFGLLCFTVCTLFFGCGKVYNSSSSDFARYGSGVAGSANFVAARAVMSNQCFTCHSNWAALDEAGFVAASLVVSRDLSGSKVYARLRGNSVNGTGNMPPAGILSTQEVEAFSTWISGM